MLLFYLTNASLDILYGCAWWVVKKTSSGIYYIFFGFKKNQVDGKIKLTDKQDNSLEALIKLQESNQIEIKKLSEQINILNNYIKNCN